MHVGFVRPVALKGHRESLGGSNRLLRPQSAADMGRKHMKTDPKPYICTFDDCEILPNSFSFAREWTEHERLNHYDNKTFRCPECQLVFSSATKCIAHVKTLCRAGIPDERIPRAVRPVLEHACPFCLKKGYARLRNFHSHVGKHMETIPHAWILEAVRKSALPSKTIPGEEDSRRPITAADTPRTDTSRAWGKESPYVHSPTDQLEFYLFDKIDNWSKATRHKINAPPAEVLEKLKVARTDKPIARQLLEMNPLRRGQIDHLLQQKLTDELDEHAEWHCVCVFETNVVTKKKQGKSVRDVRSMDVIIARRLPPPESLTVAKLEEQAPKSPAEKGKDAPTSSQSGLPSSASPSVGMPPPPRVPIPTKSGIGTDFRPSKSIFEENTSREDTLVDLGLQLAKK